MNALDHFTRGYSTDEQDKLTIQLLGIRLFNTSASALKLLLSGYYQTSASQTLTAIAFLGMSDRWSAHFYATPYEPAKFVELCSQVDKRFPTS